MRAKALAFLPSILFLACTPGTQPLFVPASPAATGVTFSNTITVSDSLTVLDFEYIYNGGGVALADVNNDGLTDIYFTGNMVSGKLYLNKGDLKFEDITDQAGVGTSVWTNGACMVDINSDGLTDIYISVGGTRNTPVGKMKNLLFVNNGNSTFTERAVSYGLAGNGYTVQSTFLDYDGDGDLDVYMLRNAFVEYSRNRARPRLKDGESPTTHKLYRNNGDSTFTDVSREAGVLYEGFGLGVQSCDLNNDHWPDLYVANDFITNDLVYINNHDGTFTNRASTYLRHQSYNAMGCDVADFNNDGLSDIAVVDMLPQDNQRWKLTMVGNNFDEFENSLKYGYEPQYIRNTLQLNNGNGTFSDISYLAGVEATDWSWGPLFADLDNDGLKDLFISNGYRQDITNLEFIKFSELSSQMGSYEGNKKERLKKLAEIPGIKVHNYFYKNNGNLTFADMSSRWQGPEPTYSNGAAYGDLDNDGDLDLVINNIDAPASIMINTDTHDRSHYLRIKLVGNEKNRGAVGAKVVLRYGDNTQVQYYSPVRGFLSTSEPYLHFGLDTVRAVDTLEVVWPDGVHQRIANVQSDQVLTLTYAGNTGVVPPATASSPLLFTPSKVAGLDFTHEENSYIDFKVQPLVPHQHSRNGPGLAVADVNGDGLEDVFIGAAKDQCSALFLQQRNGTFVRRQADTDSLTDDMGVLFFDADNDGDQDLYIVSGGTELTKGAEPYRDHFYLNDGAGNFTHTVSALPDSFESGSCVTACDYDHDGDLDLFVGGRVVPGEYPMPAKSILLRNDLKHGTCRFTDVTHEVAPALNRLGMVTSALWTDFNNDSWRDLVIAGEFMPVTFLKNNQGKGFVPLQPFQEAGWWNSLTSGDFDGDGDMDYVAGNLGWNSRYRAAKEKPLCIYAADFDKTGSIDPVMSFYRNNKLQQGHALDDMIKQMTAIRGRFKSYQPYAEAGFTESFAAEELKKAYRVCAETFASSYIENLGNDQFAMRPLPVQAQLGPVYGMLTGDYDGDGLLDILLAGNSYASDALTGRYDALTGVLLKGDGKGGFVYEPTTTTGFDISDDVKGMARLALVNGEERILCGVNNGALKTYAVGRKSRLLNPPANADHAVVLLVNGRQYKIEFYHGDTYLSQSSRAVRITDQIAAIDVYDIHNVKLQVGL